MGRAYKAFAERVLGEVTERDRLDGFPRELLEALSSEEREQAIAGLLPKLEARDEWAIQAIGYLEYEPALPTLRHLLECASGSLSAHIAVAIWRICRDPGMSQLVLEQSQRYETDDPNSPDTRTLTTIIHCLGEFDSPAVEQRLRQLQASRNYLVAWNARIVGPRSPGALPRRPSQ